MPDEAQLRKVTKRITIKPGQATLLNLQKTDGEVVFGDTLMVFEDAIPHMIVPAHLWARMVGKATRRAAQDIFDTEERQN